MSDSKISHDDQFFITDSDQDLLKKYKSKSEEEKMDQVFSGLKRRENSGFSELKKVSDEKKKSTRDEFEDMHNAYIAASDSEGPLLQIYSNSSLEEFTRQYDVSASDDNVKRTKAMMTGLLAAGTHRKLQIIPMDFRAKLNSLTEKFPNFSEVFEYIGCCCELAARSDGVLKMTPILIHGSAGSGKSLVVKAISDFLNSGDLYFEYSSMQSNSEIVGSSVFWSNSAPSKIYTKITAKYSYANFLIAHEEIDKVSVTQYDPIAALHTLLEPHTASKFIDSCYPISLNCSVSVRTTHIDEIFPI